MCVISALESLPDCPDWVTGIGDQIKIAYVSAFTAVPLAPAITSTTTNVVAGVATGTFTPAVTNDGFISFELDPSKDIEVKPMQDENGAWTTSVKASVRFSKDSLGFARKIPTRTKLILGIPKPTGEYLIVGRPGFAAIVKKWDGEESKKNSFFTIELEAEVPPMIFAGTLPAKTI